MKIEILNKLKEIKLFLFDLEGVLIPGNGNEFSESEFLAVIQNGSKFFCENSLNFGIVTARENDKLINSLKSIGGCILITSSLEKVVAVEKLITDLGIGFDKVFYAGDDILDLPLLSKCGFSAAPSNAKREVKRIVDYILKSDNSGTILSEIISLIKHSN
jgi:3-deoxy-D-manno-octulosonate 8-phosphate phosphatase (KDO 8-P phosphatase)